MANTFTSVLGGAVKSALELVLPVHCLGCATQGDILCSSCISNLPRLEAPFCAICADPGVVGVCGNCRQESGSSTGSLQGIRAPFLMEGKVREAVLSFKYRNYRVAAPCLARLMADYLMSNNLPGTVLVPVPLHKKKLRERGYNQASLLGKELGKIVGMPVMEKLLVRTRNTPPQARSGHVNQRLDNTAGAFACQQDTTGLSCILVDDVCTTGSTLGACADALVAAGATSLWGLTLARERLGTPRNESPQ